MDRTHDTDTLRLRLTELETALRKPGGISILQERELLSIRRLIGRLSVQLDSRCPITHVA